MSQQVPQQVVAARGARNRWRRGTPQGWGLRATLALSLSLHGVGIGFLGWSGGGPPASAPGRVEAMARITWERVRPERLPLELDEVIPAPEPVIVQDEVSEVEHVPEPWPDEPEFEEAPLELDEWIPSEFTDPREGPFRGPVPPFRVRRREEPVAEVEPSRPIVEPTTPRTLDPPARPKTPPMATPERSSVTLAAPLGHEGSLRRLRRLSARRRWKGEVTVRVSVSASGKPTNALVTRSSGSAAQDQAVRQVVMSWRYRPARRRGKDAPCALSIPFRF